MIIFNIYIAQINIQEDMINCALHIKIEYEITVTYLNAKMYTIWNTKKKSWIKNFSKIESFKQCLKSVEIAVAVILMIAGDCSKSWRMRRKRFNRQAFLFRSSWMVFQLDTGASVSFSRDAIYLSLFFLICFLTRSTEKGCWNYAC